jgi:hypothetical protein
MQKVDLLLRTKLQPPFTRPSLVVDTFNGNPLVIAAGSKAKHPLLDDPAGRTKVEDSS